MANSLNISLPEPLKAYVDTQIEAGQYGSVSEYVSELIQHDRDRTGTGVEGEILALEQRLLKAVANSQGAIDVTADEIRGGGVVALLRQRSKAA